MFERLIKSNQKTMAILMVLVLVTVVTVIIEPRFWTAANRSDLMKYAGLYGIIAIGVAFVIITGGIDLSIGSLIGISGVLLPKLLTVTGWSIPASFALILGIGLLIGLWHGLLITKLRLQPFVVTLCGLFIYRGIARTLGGDRKQGFGIEFTELREFFVKGETMGLPNSFVVMLLIALMAALFLNKTVYGRYLLALGRNEEAVRLSGINTDRMKIIAYMICSGLAALGGMMFVLETNSATGSNFGNFYELYAIAGAVLGGCSLRGGEGAILGVVCGAALVQVIENATFYVSDDDTIKFTVIGTFILVGVVVDELFKRYAARRKARRRVS